MAKVALISPPFISEYMRNARCDFVSLSDSSWFPIWLGQAGSYIQSKGHQTKLMDAQIEKKTKEQAIDDIKKFGADIVAVYTGRLSEESDVKFGDDLAELGFQVVFVGPYASIEPKDTLNLAQHAKYLVRKEFDLPIEELASGKRPEEIQNFCYKTDSGDIVENPNRPLYTTEILDTFPLTSQYFNEQLKIENYRVPSEPYPFLDLMSGRGCAWGKCDFCLWVQSFVPGTVYNLRSIDHFMAEFDYVNKHMPQVRCIMIQDDMITAPRAIEISEALLKKDYKINWSCYAKPNSNLKLETLKLMKRSGCLNLHVGFESGDKNILTEIDKGSTVEQAIKFGEDAHKAGLHMHADFAMGFFGETLQSMEETIKVAKKINPHTAQFQIMIPFKGTKFMEKLKTANAMNEKGEPSYEKMGGASADEIRAMAKKAYRSFYISPQYFKRMLTNPKMYVQDRFTQYLRAIPAVTFKKWVK